MDKQLKRCDVCEFYVFITLFSKMSFISFQIFFQMNDCKKLELCFSKGKLLRDKFYLLRLVQQPKFFVCNVI